MRPDDIRGFLQRQPFRPFRLTLSNGQIYEVRHPELAMVGRSTVTIGLPSPGDPEPIYDRLVTVSLLHVLKIEPQELAESPA